MSDPVTSAYEQTADATSALRESAADVASETADVWESENYIEDEYGLYNEDFSWTTKDEWFETINDQPVLFASNVAELHIVGHGADLEQAQQKNQQSASKESGNKTASSTQATRTNQQPIQGSNVTDGADAAIVYLFNTDNFGRDDYGYYDEDFVWTTSDPTYDRWNTSDAYVWNDMETAHYDIYGFDDVGEQGLWDW